MPQSDLALDQADVVKSRFLEIESTGIAFNDNQLSNTFIQKNWQNGDAEPS